MDYDSYNREERAICSHLFRLLHENLDQKQNSPLGKFLNILLSGNLQFKNQKNVFKELSFENIRIYSEVSIIRDKYHSLKPEVSSFMDDLARIIMKQEGVNDCRLFSELPEVLRNPSKTHAKQIRQKAESENIELLKEERIVYGSVQGMINAKPDILITIDNIMFVGEAKFTESFDSRQLERTWNIAEVWSKLIYKDLGFSEKPVYTVFKLGADKFDPDISWIDVLEITKDVYSKDDRTLISIQAGVDLLGELNLKY